MRDTSGGYQPLIKGRSIAVSVVAISVLMSGCASTGNQHRADVFKAGQVNQAQEAKVIKILAVMPAKIEVDNSGQRKQAEVAGAVVGALLGGAITSKSSKRPISGANPAAGALVGAVAGGVAGSLVSDTNIVDGVSITYLHDNKTLNSAQVGRICEYRQGDAIMISTSPMESRIQPNAECPIVEAKQ